MTVHVIDHDPGVREGLTAALRAEGWSVASFAGSDRFLDVAAMQAGDIVVLDLDLPHGASRAIARAVRARGTDIRLISVSGLRAHRWRQAVREACPNEIHRKPLSSRALFASVQRAAGGYVVSRT